MGMRPMGQKIKSINPLKFFERNSSKHEYVRYLGARLIYRGEGRGEGVVIRYFVNGFDVFIEMIVMFIPDKLPICFYE